MSKLSKSIAVRARGFAVLASLVLMLPATPARAERNGSYLEAMAACDGIAVIAPLVLSGVVLLGQGALFIYARLDTTFPAERYAVLGAVGVSATGYVVCGPATHIAHRHAERAPLSLLLRAGLPVAAIGLTSLIATAASASAPAGDHFGPSGGEAAAGLAGAVLILGAFVGGAAVDYGLAATPAIAPTVAPTPGGLTAGVTARW